jgi:hypothetical protein
MVASLGTRFRTLKLYIKPLDFRVYIYTYIYAFSYLH